MTQNKKTLIDEVIQFFENEREIYGDFTPKEITLNSEEVETEPSTTVSKEESILEEKPGESLNEKLLACSTLQELKSLCELVDDLKTDLDNTNLVFGVGNQNADLMIIGEAPGENEDKQGEPFVGAAGQLLDKIMGAIKFNRDDIYLANILKHRPPDNRNPTSEERERSLPYLLRQIDIIQPKIILCVGKVSGTTLLEKDEALKNMRGTFYPYRGAELTVTYHPAALLRNPDWKRPTWEDVQAVRKRYDELNGKP